MKIPVHHINIIRNTLIEYMGITPSEDGDSFIRKLLEEDADLREGLKLYSSDVYKWGDVTLDTYEREFLSGAIAERFTTFVDWPCNGDEYSQKLRFKNELKAGIASIGWTTSF